MTEKTSNIVTDMKKIIKPLVFEFFEFIVLDYKEISLHEKLV